MFKVLVLIQNIAREREIERERERERERDRERYPIIVLA
jgi:hypothetical protein